MYEKVLRAKLMLLRMVLEEVRIWMKNLDRREHEEKIYQAVREVLNATEE
jgi:hypothetical protein